MSSSAPWVLDASVVLVCLHRESGHEEVTSRLESAVINAVNLSEVAAKLCEAGLSLDEVVAVTEALGIGVVPCDRDLAFRAASLRTVTKEFGLSLGDRICLATAQRLGAGILTSDKIWAAAENERASALK